MIEKELERLLRDAKADAGLKAELLKTRESGEPVEDFCALARQKAMRSTQASCSPWD